MSSYVLPVLFLAAIAFAAVKKISVYDCLTEGVKEALSLCFKIAPFVIAIMPVIELMKESGLTAYVSEMIRPFFEGLAIPPELLQLILIKPLSGNGSLAVLESIYKDYGADSYIARVASVIMGSSDTTLYIAGVYFSDTNIKKLRYGIPVALIASFFGCIFSCLIVRVL